MRSLYTERGCRPTSRADEMTTHTNSLQFLGASSRPTAVFPISDSPPSKLVPSTALLSHVKNTVPKYYFVAISEKNTAQTVVGRFRPRYLADGRNPPSCRGGSKTRHHHHTYDGCIRYNRLRFHGGCSSIIKLFCPKRGEKY